MFSLEVISWYLGKVEVDLTPFALLAAASPSCCCAQPDVPQPAAEPTAHRAGCISPTWSQFCPDVFQLKRFIRLIDLAPGGIHFQCCYVCTLNVSRRWSLLGGREQTPDVAHWSVTGIFLQDSSWEKFFACQPPWASPPHILQLTQCTLERLQVLLIKLLSPLTL